MQHLVLIRELMANPGRSFTEATVNYIETDKSSGFLKM